jgi:hypothetical protein
MFRKCAPLITSRPATIPYRSQSLAKSFLSVVIESFFIARTLSVTLSLHLAYHHFAVSL